MEVLLTIGEINCMGNALMPYIFLKCREHLKAEFKIAEYWYHFLTFAYATQI